MIWILSHLISASLGFIMGVIVMAFICRKTNGEHS